MAFGTPPVFPASTGSRRRASGTEGPPTAQPPQKQETPPTPTTTPPTTTPSTPPTGTLPNPDPGPPNPNPAPPASFPPITLPTGRVIGGQQPAIPYYNNEIILPSEWSQAYPGVPYPTGSVRGEDASRVQLDQYMTQTEADRVAQTSAADALGSQYEAWLRGTQERSFGQLLGGIGSASGINQLNNRALQNSADNQLALNNEQRIRNGLDQQGIDVSNRYLGVQRGLAGEQRNADIGRIQGQWALRNGQIVSDQDYIRGVWGRATEQYGADQAQSAAMADQARLGYGYAADDLSNQVNRVGLQEGANRRAAVSDSAGRGAFGSAGFKDNVADIGELADLSRESAWNQYERSRDATTGELRDIDYGRGNLDRRYAGDVANFQKQLEDNQRNYEGDVLNFRYGIGQADRDYRNTTAGINRQLEDNNLARQALQSMARSYGIQDRDIVQTLQTATERNNINLSQLISDMNVAYQQGDADRILQFNQFLYNLIGM